MDKKMKGKLFLAGVSLGLTFAEAYFQHKKSKNKDEKIEKLITEVRNELGGSRIEITPKHIKMRTEKLDVIDGVDLTLDTNEITVSKHEKQFNTLSSKVDVIEEGLSNRLERLENEVFAPVEDLYASDKSPVLQGVIDTESFAFPSTLEEYNNLYKSTCDLANKLDTDNLEKLNAIWSGSYMCDMKDFHSLVAQLFVIQEASKKKGNG